MKRTVAFLIALLLIFSQNHEAYAYDSSLDGIGFYQYSGVYYPRVKQGEAMYYMSRPLEKLPCTLEAWVRLEGGDERSGVLFSNKDDGYGAHISYETSRDGTPIYRYTDAALKTQTLVFDNAKIAPKRWVHLAIVQDGDKIFCYIDGKLRQSASGCRLPHGDTLKKTFTIGGDSEYQNYPPFHGRVRSLCLFYTPLTEENIKAHLKNGVQSGDSGLLASYTLSADKQGYDIKDDSKNGYDLIYSKMWLTQTEQTAKTDRAYSIAVVGDTQYMTEFFPESLDKLYRYIALGKDERNIRCVVGLGDMTNRDTEYEWQNVKRATAVLDSIPFMMVRGNHDIRKNSAASNNAYHLSQSGVDTDIGKSTGGHGFDSVFAKDAQYTAGLGGVYSNGSVTNAWRIIECGSTKWLILALDYLPSDGVLEWAAAVVGAHSDCRVIVTTHAYLNRNGEPLDYAEYIWDDFVSQHKNIRLVISGHINSGRIIVSKQAGVTQMLIDMQTCDSRFRGAGFVTFLHFNKDGSECEVECISTASESEGLYYRGINQFKFKLK